MSQVEVVGVKIRIHNSVYTLPVEADDIYEEEGADQISIYLNWKEQMCRLLQAFEGLTLLEDQSETPPEYNNEE
tara:strand:- start:2486 stop:2707 length:222 start_codon:yes stop_codon:yes gene_type:complete